MWEIKLCCESFKNFYCWSCATVLNNLRSNLIEIKKTENIHETYLFLGYSATFFFFLLHFYGLLIPTQILDTVYLLNDSGRQGLTLWQLV